MRKKKFSAFEYILGFVTVLNLIGLILDLFCHILSLQAAKMFMHAMVLSHMTYCPRIWLQANKTALNPSNHFRNKQLKQWIKTLSYHHFNHFMKHKVLS